jgi:hypothetical protein
MLNTEFNPFDMATQGLLSGNPFTISIQGHLTIIEIEPIPPSIIEQIGDTFIPEWVVPKEKRKKKFKIKVTVLKDGKEYVEEHIVKSIAPPYVKDVHVGIDKENSKVIVEINNPNIKTLRKKIYVNIIK